MPDRSREDGDPSPDRRDALRASVVIATFNRKELLGKVLAALAGQTAPAADFEVVVVDDGSPDGTAEWLASQRFPFRCRCLRQANTGPSGARNAGMAAAAGEILIFLDDDLIPAPEFVAEHLRSHAAEPGPLAVVGPAASLDHYDQPWIAWQQATFEKAYRDMADGTLEPTFKQFWTGNCSAPRRDVVAVGGFDREVPFGEDVELGYRLMRERGLRFRFNPAATGDHHSRRAFGRWLEACTAYGTLDGHLLGPLGRAGWGRFLAQEWRSRHRLTRGLVRWSAGVPARTAATRVALSGCIRAGTLAPMSAFSRTACSALANLVYWDGLAAALGEGRSLFALLDELGAELGPDEQLGGIDVDFAAAWDRAREAGRGLDRAS